MRLWITESCQALRILITAVADDFVASADDIMGAVALRATPTLPTVSIGGARLITVEEVSARISSAASRIALKVVITCVLDDLLTVETL